MATATNENWYIPYNGPIEPPSSQFRTRPRGNTFGGLGMDSALSFSGTGMSTSNPEDYYDDRDGEDDDHTFGQPYPNSNMKSSAPVLAHPGGRPRAGSHSSSISAYSTTQNFTNTRTFFGGTSTTSGIGEAPVHPSHREKEREYHREKEQHTQPRGTSFGLAPRLSIYTNMMRGSDREKEKSSGTGGDRASVLSTDWDNGPEDSENYQQRASIVSFLTFGRRGAGTGRASPISPISHHPSRGRAGSPVSLMSGVVVGRPSHDSTRTSSRVAMLPIGEKTGTGLTSAATRRGLISSTPYTAPAHIPMPSSPAGLSPISPAYPTASSSSLAFAFPPQSQQSQGSTKPIAFQVKRNRSLRNRSDTVDSAGSGNGNGHGYNGVRGNGREGEGQQQRGRAIDGSGDARLGGGHLQNQRQHDVDEIVDVDRLMGTKMDREWYEEAGYGPTDEQSVGAARGRTQLRDGQSRNDYEIPTNNPTRRLSHSASHPILSSHATASSSGAPRIAGPSSSTIASVRATHPYALVFPTTAASSSSITPYHPRPQPSHQIQNANAYAYERQDPHSAQTQWQQPRHAHIGSQTSVHATSAGPGARAGAQGYDRDAVYPFDAPSASASASAPAHGLSRTFRMQQPYEPGYAYDYDSSPQSAFQLQSQQQQQQQNPFSPTIERVSTLSPHPYSQAHPAHKVSEASMAAAARATKSSSVRGTKGSNSLRYSLSTPNLRNFFRMGSSDKDKEKEKEKEKKQVVKIKTQYTAETWCDALVFPRPRFRAHIISPPASPLPGDSAIIERAVDLSRITNLSPQAQAQAGPSNINAFASSSSVRLPTYHQSPSADHLGTYASHFSLDTPQNSVRVPKVNLQSPPPGKLKAHKKQNASKSTTSTGAPQLPPLPTDNVNLSMTEEALIAGAQRDRERAEWNVLAKKSFQNRRSRSLSRPRKKSLGAGANASKISLRERVDSEASAESTRGRTTGLSVTKALTNLAAEVFRQPTPTISSVSNQGHGIGTESGLSHSHHGHHSRNTSDSYGRGGAHGHTHARNTSWGKAALKKLCGPEEDVVQAEIEEAMRKRMQLEEALKNEGTMRIGIGNRARTEEDHERQRAREREVQF
ncbi:hypothetical protein M422DRAFT_781293, partial [Sphaerobolus stellatus SS14]